MSLKTFIAGYLTCAFFTTPEAGTPEALPSATYAQVEADCRAFYEANAARWEGQWLSSGSPWSEDEQAGHDFWLTRNRHGAGFWDGDWAQPAAQQLTAAAHAFGECELEVGIDDGELVVA